MNIFLSDDFYVLLQVVNHQMSVMPGELAELQSQVVLLKEISLADDVADAENQLTSVNEHWEDVQHTVAERQSVLQQATDAWQELDDGTTTINSWVDNVQNLLQKDVVYTSYEQVKDKLEEMRTQAAEATRLQSQLEGLANIQDHLEQLCDSDIGKTKYQETKARFLLAQAEVLERLAALEDVSEDWSAHQNEVDKVLIWMEQAKNRLATPGDEDLSLEEQLEAQEVS